MGHLEPFLFGDSTSKKRNRPGGLFYYPAFSDRSDSAARRRHENLSRQAL